ncbi:MAG: shikimate dehydrogenase [Rubrivivax sp.]|nr:shikimate dehydrogenase [Rubrivivax sp.]MBK8525661.1 shikimate dehydrogenase [Rubrivivax sp.]
MSTGTTALPNTATLTRYAVIGHPVTHSQSPYIHAAFAAQTGEPVEYGRIDCGAADFVAAVSDFAAGGAGGCNITVPFKFDAANLAAHTTERARLAGAANVLRFDREGWLADNTDGSGLVRDIERNAAWPLADRRVLLIGAGGAAAGVLGPLLTCRPRKLVLVNRRPERALALIQRHAAWARHCGVGLETADIDNPGDGFDTVINATASSLQDGAVPVPARVLGAGALAVDLMYGPAAQGFVDWAQAHGARGRDGLGMLVEQAAEAFFVWRGVHPDSLPVLQALRQRLANPA